MGNVAKIGAGLFGRAGLGTEGPIRGGMFQLAERLLDDPSCVVVSARAPVEAALAKVGGRPKIVIAKMGVQRSNFACARMIARLELTSLGCWSLDIELALAAWLVAPPDAIRGRLVQCGIDLRRLAMAFGVTETCAALRVVEVGAADGVVVTPAKVYRPGAALAWCGDDDLRKLARRSPRSVRKVAIQDEPGRAALFKIGA